MKKLVENRHSVIYYNLKSTLSKIEKNLSRDPNNFRYKQLKEIFALFRVKEKFDLMSQVLHFRNNNAARGCISK